jgi:sigma-B regulation protein RsbQ
MPHHHHNLTMAGIGPGTLLFAHGYGCDQDMWRMVIPGLTDRWRVAAFDHAGCGRRGLVPYDPRRHAGLDGYADDVVALIRNHGLGPVVFVGHSVSAMIGVLACRRAPELFRALVMIGPSPCYLDDGDYRGGFRREDIEGLLAALDANHRTWAATLAPQIMGNLDRPALADELQESFCRMDPAAARGFARATFTADNRGDLAHVRVPTLIMQCSQDAIANPAVGDFVHARIPGSTLVRLAATGHCPNLSAPAEVVAVLSGWLASLDG